MPKSPKNVTPLQAGGAVFVLLAVISGTFWVLDPASPSRQAHLRAWLHPESKQPEWVDLWQTVKFSSVSFSYRELQGERSKDQAGASRAGIAPAAGGALIQPVIFRTPSSRFLTWQQRTALSQSVLSQLQHGDMLADIVPAETPAIRSACALNYRIEVRALPDGLLFCKLRGSVDRTVTVAQPQPGYTSIPLGEDRYGGYPTEFFTTRDHLYEDLRKAIKIDLDNMVDRVHPERRRLPSGGFPAGARGLIDDSVQLYPPSPAPVRWGSSAEQNAASEEEEMPTPAKRPVSH